MRRTLAMLSLAPGPAPAGGGVGDEPCYGRRGQTPCAARRDFFGILRLYGHPVCKFFDCIHVIRWSESTPRVVDSDIHRVLSTQTPACGD